MNLLDRAVKLAAEQDEPDDMNFVRKHAKEQVHGGGSSLCGSSLCGCTVIHCWRSRRKTAAR